MPIANPVDRKEPVPPGHIASIITHLQMTQKPRPAPLPSAPLTIRKAANIRAKDYQTLFRLVGAPWLWFGRLCQSDDEIERILADPHIALFIIEDRKGESAGMLELDFRTPCACEIAYLGLVSSLNGKGFGKWLMAHSLMLSWAGLKTLAAIERVWLKTCTLDHPAAMPFYRKNGFMPYAQETEIYPDPRLSGLLPMDSAPQIPLLDGKSEQ
jgi:GNAT superfamily N-acetyltransferase